MHAFEQQQRCLWTGEDLKSGLSRGGEERRRGEGSERRGGEERGAQKTPCYSILSKLKVYRAIDGTLALNDGKFDSAQLFKVTTS